MDDNLLGSIMIKNFSASIAGKCHEKAMVFIIEYPVIHKAQVACIGFYARPAQRPALR
jgi:hypothetical protein